MDVDAERNPADRVVVARTVRQVLLRHAVKAADSTSLANTDLFAGRDVTPDDLDGAGAEPYATTRVTLATGDDEVRYALRHLEPGDYTLAVTCRGDLEALGQDDDLRFRGARNVALESDESTEVDFD